MQSMSLKVDIVFVFATCPSAVLLQYSTTVGSVYLQLNPFHCGRNDIENAAHL